MKIKSPKDFWSGLMFIASGGFFAVWAVFHYQMGTAVRMGPAYFPTLLGGLLTLLGVIIAATLVICALAVLYRPGARGLVLVSAACVFYGYLMKPLGLVLAGTIE